MASETSGIDLEALIAAEYASLRRHVEVRLLPLLARRALLATSVPAPAPVFDIPEAAVVSAAPEREPAAAERPGPPRVRAHTAQLIIDLLWEAPLNRLPGADLNRVVTDAGYTKDAAEKIKTRLRKLGVLIKDPGISFWSLAPHVLATGSLTARPDVREAGDVLEAEGREVIVDALADAGEVGLTGDALLREAARRGVPPTRAILLRGQLRAARRIECNGGPGARWRIAGAATWAEGGRPQAAR